MLLSFPLRIVRSNCFASLWLWLFANAIFIPPRFHSLTLAAFLIDSCDDWVDGMAGGSHETFSFIAYSLQIYRSFNLVISSNRFIQRPILFSPAVFPSFTIPVNIFTHFIHVRQKQQQTTKAEEWAKANPRSKSFQLNFRNENCQILLFSIVNILIFHFVGMVHHAD